jgi:hypothetical protein
MFYARSIIKHIQGPIGLVGNPYGIYQPLVRHWDRSAMPMGLLVLGILVL